ncbi:MAG: peptidoglycan-binding domain-containing protein [Candidatus Omnitrophica bacterium]|nr:peptidoglycan-binding domain-containing protein [Candidatus Omnitrophota bacterium]MDD5654133.1 peptidoglycan-binding domain-containing protein [Candidatus Omnitrophota bacterium]
MVRRYLPWLVLVFFVVSMAGCATCKKRDTEIQGLKDKVQALESESQVKDNEISNLREALARQVQESDQVMSGSEAKESKQRPTVKQVQRALKNAGYNPGAIDGKMGKQTREAIRDFQRANGLAIDGKAGKLTWALLKKYLNKTK